MPNPSFTKCTMFFTDGRFGWQEAYYYQTAIFAGTPPKLVQAAWQGLQAALSNLVAARLPLLAQTAATCAGSNCVGPPKLAYIRCSTVGIARATMFLVPNGCGGTALAGGITSAGNGSGNGNSPVNQAPELGAADNPYSGLELVLSLANGLTAKRTISGVPDSVICDQQYQACGGWMTLFSTFAKILIQSLWGVASNSLGSNATVPATATPITGISQDDPYGRPTLTLAAPITFATNNSGCPDFRVVIQCYKSNPGRWPNINGVHRVVVNSNNPSATTNEVQLTQGYKPLSPWIYGFAYPYPGPFFVDIVGAQILGPTFKKRGGPFDRPRGRVARTQ